MRIIRGSENTMWFWHLWVPLQAHVPDWLQEYILWIDPYEWSIFKIHDILSWSGVQWWRFPEYLEEVHNFKVKSTGKTNKILCSLCNHGFYKASPGCMFNQPDVDYETDIRVKSWMDWKCYKQHRMICKYNKRVKAALI